MKISYNYWVSSKCRKKGAPADFNTSLAPFGLSRNRFVRLIFSARTIFFSHNISAGTVFSSQIQPAECVLAAWKKQRKAALDVYLFISAETIVDYYCCVRKKYYSDL